MSKRILAQIFVVLAGSIVLLWPTVFNKSPFWFPDTTAYVRGPDLAVQKLLGETYTSEWSRGTKRSENKSEDTEELSKIRVTPKPSGLNQPEQGEVMGGRSVYYGSLLYLGHITGDFWLSILVQCFTMSWLVFTICRLYLAYPERYALPVILALSVLTSLGFFANFLMPDVFASVTILSASLILIEFDRLSRWEAVFVVFCLAAATTFHSTHLGLAVLALPLGIVVLLLAKISLPKILLRTIIIGSCVLTGIIANLTFELAVTKILGKPPLWPPFILARSIADGPGFIYLKEHCHAERFETCNFLDRLPTESSVFLWSDDPKTGIFLIADSKARRRISDEQFDIVVPAALARPIDQLSIVIERSLRQIVTFDLGFGNAMEWFEEHLPERYFAQLKSSRNAHGKIPWSAINVAQYVFVFFALSVFAFSLALWLRAPNRRANFRDALRFERLGLLITIVGLLVLANASMCGVLSSIEPRYQARVIWLLPFLALVQLLKVLDPKNPEPSSKNAERTSIQ